MKCENLQFNLSLYIDKILSGEEREIVNEHLAECPLCRQKLDDFGTLRQSLRQISQPVMPKDLLASVKTAMRTELAPSVPVTKSYFSHSFREFLQMRVMPLTVGTAASLVFGFSFLWILLSGANVKQTTDFTTLDAADQSPILVAKKSKPDDIDINQADFVAGRGLVSSESPSINPQGALAAMTKAFVNGKSKGNEVVVVADVFSNGLANIEEVVEPLDNEQAVFELEQALNKDSGDAPFVPALLDRRADSMRVVLKIQRVDINTSQPKAKRK
jgi:Putative zinc-finger